MRLSKWADMKYCCGFGMQDQQLQVAGRLRLHSGDATMLGRARAMLPADDAVGGAVKYPCTSISAEFIIVNCTSMSIVIEECGEGE